jgi:hypothetical protein
MHLCHRIAKEIVRQGLWVDYGHFGVHSARVIWQREAKGVLGRIGDRILLDMMSHKVVLI